MPKLAYVLVLLAGGLFADNGKKQLSTVPVLVSSDSSIYEEAIAGMQSVAEFQSNIQYLEPLLAENTDMAEWFRTLRAQNPPLVIAIGQKAAQLALQHLNDIPVVFSMVSGAKSLLSAQGKSCGVSMDIPAGEFFATLREIKPQARRVVGFYSVENSETAFEGAYQDLKHGLVYQPIRVSSAAEFSRFVAALDSNTDAVLMTADPIYTKENFDLLSRAALEKKIILMTPFAPLVKIGANFALTADYTHLGILTGEMANRILQGKSDCRSELVRFPENSYFYLNEDFAARQEITLPESIKARAQTTRLFTAVAKLLNEEKYLPARKILEAMIERDPNNRTAAVYLDIVLEKLTGNKLRILLAQAEAFMRERKYAMARLQYQEALRLNSKSEKAREGLKQAIYLQSEEARMAAGRRAALGDIYEAIRGYQHALSILPSNSKARSELAALRSREARKIPELMQQGLAAYNQRDYNSAIRIFDNVLLIQPGHNQATEYLRLSRQKREAADRLYQQQSSGAQK